jgi:hypothetical protein
LTVSVEFPWPEDPERVERRVRGLVESVLRPGELVDVRLEWVTPRAHQWDDPHAAWVALRVVVMAATEDDGYEREIWGPDWYCTWERELDQFANDIEDWVCETSFAWGQERRATVPS